MCNRCSSCPSPLADMLPLTGARHPFAPAFAPLPSPADVRAAARPFGRKGYRSALGGVSPLSPVTALERLA